MTSPRPISTTETVALHSRFPIARSVFEKDAVDRVLARATARHYATLSFTVQHWRTLRVAQARVRAHRLRLCTRTYPQHNTIVYWLESR